jgi:hypothetical protein
VKIQSNPKFMRGLVVVVALGVFTGSGAIANAASKSIICYKGTASKKVTAAAPKCPTGWSTKKPVVKPVVKTTPKPTASATTKATGAKVVMAGTYKGKIALVWSDSNVTASSVTAAGTGNTAGLDELTGSGDAEPSAQSNQAITGRGVLGSGANTLKIAFDTGSKASAKDGDAPTTVTFTGNASVISGTGKFAGATGTLEVSGTFKIASKDAGFTEKADITLTISGTINTK